MGVETGPVTGSPPPVSKEVKEAVGKASESGDVPQDVKNAAGGGEKGKVVGSKGGATEVKEGKVKGEGGVGGYAGGVGDGGR